MPAVFRFQAVCVCVRVQSVCVCARESEQKYILGKAPKQRGKQPLLRRLARTLTRSHARLLS